MSLDLAPTRASYHLAFSMKHWLKFLGWISHVPHLSSFYVELVFAQSVTARERNVEGHFPLPAVGQGSQDISAQQQAGLNWIQSPTAEWPHPLLKIRNKNHRVICVARDLQRSSKSSLPVMGKENFTSSKPHPTLPWTLLVINNPIQRNRLGGKPNNPNPKTRCHLAGLQVTICSNQDQRPRAAVLPISLRPHLLHPQWVQLSLQACAQPPLHLLPLLTGRLQLCQRLLQLFHLLHIGLLPAQLWGTGVSSLEGTVPHPGPCALAGTH